jgi:hypothetical protein
VLEREDKARRLAEIARPPTSCEDPADVPNFIAFLSVANLAHGAISAARTTRHARGEMMGHRGRRRQAGEREPSGRLRRLQKVERDRLDGEKSVVLRQQHRQGDSDQLRESPLGRFVLRRHMRREIYDAGVEFGCLVRFFLRARGIE